MKCQNCNKNLKKLSKPLTRIENINTLEGLMRVTFEQRYKCPGCEIQVGVAVKTELLQPKPSLRKKKEVLSPTLTEEEKR